MKKIILLLIALFIFLPSVVSANGMAFVDYSKSVYMPSQKATIVWSEGVEILNLSTKIKLEDVANVAWVIPVPSDTKPEVEEGNMQIFYALADYFEGGGKSSDGFFGIGSESDSESVEVLESKEVGIYDISILKADNARILLTWLNNNGYNVPQTAAPVLGEYASQENFYFIANKIDLKNWFTGPMVITQEETDCLNLVRTNIEDYGFESMTDFSQQVQTYMSMNEKKCASANANVVEKLAEIEYGISTPLEITFAPGEPFFPQKMSSLGEGETNIDVYVFADFAYEDRKGPLEIKKSRRTDYFEENHNIPGRYVTHLSFSGDVDELTSDSWLTPTEDSGFVGLGERETWEYQLRDLKNVFWNYVAPVSLLIFAGIGLITVIRFFVMGIKKLTKKSKKRFRK